MAGKRDFLSVMMANTNDCMRFRDIRRYIMIYIVQYCLEKNRILKINILYESKSVVHIYVALCDIYGRVKKNNLYTINCIDFVFVKKVEN